MPGKFAVVLHEGDTIRHDQPGGGGFGDPFERDPEAVAADVRNDKVTVEHARQAYGVVIDPVTLKVDADATRAMRAKASR
jgi:N-methylhydantoinase B